MLNSWTTMKAAAVLLALAMLAGQPAGWAARAQVTSLPAESIAERLLAAHNAERQRLGIRPLVWSAKLADHAKTWSQALAVSDMMEHSVAAANANEGENLWFGTKADYTPEEMVGAFVEEGSLFKRGVFPNVSANGRWEDVGHYTQLIWQDTREVGCAITSNQRRDVLVCRYAPAGNTEGQKVYDYSAPAQKAVLPAKATVPATSAKATGPAPLSPTKPRKRALKKHQHGG